jgi:hypothetical protein
LRPLESPKPFGMLRVEPTIWKIWVFISHTFVSLFNKLNCMTKTQIDQIVRLETVALHRTGSFNFQNQSSQKKFQNFLATWQVQETKLSIQGLS